jgi:myosin heavy subunit
MADDAAAADAKEQRRLSMAPADAGGWDVGQRVHVADVKNKEQAWAKGVVVGTEGNSRVNVQVDGGGAMVSVDLKKVKALYTVNPKTNYDDMTSLYYLHEPGVSENLGVRYAQDNIYTYIGRVLVVCNPFKRLPMPEPKAYAGKKLSANPPHSYAVADAAYAALKKSGGAESQSVIISGESGAGKTESSKIVMQVAETSPPF